jgi:hypothetical protein
VKIVGLAHAHYRDRAYFAVGPDGVILGALLLSPWSQRETRIDTFNASGESVTDIRRNVAHAEDPLTGWMNTFASPGSPPTEEPGARTKARSGGRPRKGR